MPKLTTPSYRDTVPITLLRNFVRVYQNISSKDAGFADSYQLSTAEIDVVFTLGNTDGMRMCELASKMLMSAGNMTKVIKKLVDRGLVNRQRNQQSEREVLVSLTDAGEELFVKAYPAAYQHTASMFDACLSAPEQQQLLQLLDKMMQHLPKTQPLCSTDGKDGKDCKDDKESGNGDDN